MPNNFIKGIPKNYFQKIQQCDIKVKDTKFWKGFLAISLKKITFFEIFILFVPPLTVTSFFLAAQSEVKTVQSSERAEFLKKLYSKFCI